MPDHTGYLDDSATETAALYRRLEETEAECERLRELLTNEVKDLATERLSNREVAELWRAEMEQARAEGYAAGVQAERERWAIYCDKQAADSKARAEKYGNCMPGVKASYNRSATAYEHLAIAIRAGGEG